MGNNRMRRTSRRLGPRESRVTTPQSVFRAESEQITTELIEETLDILRKRFAELTVNHHEMMGETEAAQIMECLIKEAVSHRSLLMGRVEKSVEEGPVFERYYGKIREIDALTGEAYTLMKQRDAAKKRFDEQRAIYRKVVGKTYVSDVLPEEPENPTVSKGNWEDVWQLMNDRKRVEEG